MLLVSYPVVYSDYGLNQERLCNHGQVCDGSHCHGLVLAPWLVVTLFLVMRSGCV